MSRRNSKRRNIALYNQYTSSSIGAVNNNDVVTPRTKHVYFDSREDVRIRGKKQTMEKGLFQATLATNLKNVKRIVVHQITMPGTMHNVINRHVKFKATPAATKITYVRDLVFTNISLSYQNLDDLALRLTQEFTQFLTGEGVSNVDPPVFTISSDDNDSLTITGTQQNASPYIWEVDFNPEDDPTDNLGPFLGIDPNQNLINDNPDLSQHLTGNSIPDINGFNYMYIRCPELNLNSEFNLTEIDYNKKTDILGRVPVNYSENVMTFDSSWFYPHVVDINIVKNLTFQFYYYNGTSPNFNNENISLVLIFDYYD